MSSKSLAANFFISDTLLANRRMVSLPKVGIWRNLWKIDITDQMNINGDLPVIQLIHSMCTHNMQDANQVGENGLPDAKFYFMHQVNNKEAIMIDTKRCQSVPECILEKRPDIRYSDRLSAMHLPQSVPANDS
jgi:hypothetical protein